MRMKAEGIAVIVMKAVGHGLFLKGAADGSFDSRFKTDKNPELHRFAPPREAFDQPHPSADELVRYAMSLPVSTVLAGLDSPATLASVVNTASTFSPMTVAEMREIHQRAQVFSGTGYWIPRPA